MLPATLGPVSCWRRGAGCLLVTLTAFSLGACRSESSVGLNLPPGIAASVELEGSNPFIVVDNHGPGMVDVRFAPSAASFGVETEHLIRGATGRTMRGGGSIRITNTSDKPADVSLTATNHTGLAVTQSAAKGERDD